MITYDRYMREFRLKRLSEQLKREDAPGVSEEMIVPAIRVVQVIRQAHKDTMRNMEGM